MTAKETLSNFAKKVSKSKALRKKPIAFVLRGTGGGDYFFDCATGEAHLMEGRPSTTPLIQMTGDTRKILAVLEGKKDARSVFLTGGFRIRGDFHYINELALELGMIKEPI